MTEETAKPVEFDIPKECKAGVCYNEGPDYELKVEMVPVPEPGPDEILIKLNATGICMSDVHWLMNDLAPVPMSTYVLLVKLCLLVLIPQASLVSTLPAMKVLALW
jgi:propanol-preferring alcohol dehydrogenase